MLDANHFLSWWRSGFGQEIPADTPLAGGAPGGVQENILIFFLLRNCMLGVAIGWGILTGLLYFNISGLGELLFASEHLGTALLLLGVGFAVTFGSLAMGTAIFLLPRG